MDKKIAEFAQKSKVREKSLVVESGVDERRIAQFA
jgi:hypothetical protein